MNRRESIPFRSRGAKIGNGEHASTFIMPELRNELQGSDRNDNGTTSLAKVCDGIGDNKDVPVMLPGF